MRIKRRVATTEAEKPIRRLLLITQQAIMGAWTRVEAVGVERSTSLNPMKVPFLRSNISSFIWSDLTVGFWMCLDNTIFFPLKRGRKDKWKRCVAESLTQPGIVERKEIGL